MQLKLFQKHIAVRQKTKQLTCRNCSFRYKHYYGKMFYCEKQKQKGTAYGHKKIKAGDIACLLYEDKNKKKI